MGERDPLMAMAGQDSLTRFYETQYLILSSRPMAYRIIESLNLADHPDYQILREQNPEKSPVEINSIIADAFLKKLEVRPKKRSYLVDVAFESDDKRLAQQVPNAIAQEYVKFSMNTRQQSYALIKEWLEKELETGLQSGGLRSQAVPAWPEEGLSVFGRERQCHSREIRGPEYVAHQGPI